MEESEDEYFQTREEDFNLKKYKVRTALLEYLHYFDMNPDAEIQHDIFDDEDEGDDNTRGLVKIALDPKSDVELAHRIIIRVAKLLARLRTIGTNMGDRWYQGSEYSYGLANPEIHLEQSHS